MNIVHPTTKRRIRNVVECCLHESLKPYLIFAQICGQFPLDGILAKDITSIRFTYVSLKFAYSASVCLGIGILVGFNLYEALKFGAHLNLISDLIFYCAALLLSIGFLRIAQQWKGLLNEWRDVEILFSNYTYFPSYKFNLNFKIISISGIFIAIVEYSLKVTNSVFLAATCKSLEDTVLKYYFQNILFKEIFAVIAYSPIIGFILQVIDLLAYILILLTDVFVIIMSTALASRYRQINWKIKFIIRNKDKTFSWVDIRAHYNKLCRLCKSLDHVISPIILISFAYNLFAILIQLFNSLRSMRHHLENAYFFFSFGCVILRVVTVTLYGAWINDESKRPADILNSVPSEIYNLEVRRFLMQISFDDVALSGKGFFRVTRSLILSIAGAIVTYELVLIQFNENLLNEERGNTSSNGC